MAAYFPLKCFPFNFLLGGIEKPLNVSYDPKIPRCNRSNESLLDLLGMLSLYSFCIESPVLAMWRSSLLNLDLRRFPSSGGESNTQTPSDNGLKTAKHSKINLPLINVISNWRTGTSSKVTGQRRVWLEQPGERH